MITKRIASALAVIVAAWTLHPGAQVAKTATPFAALVDRLSEPGGDFDSDNLISNERSYLDVVPALIAGGVNGGAYVGVGPDQNFSYIARVRPSVAYIIDIRRDNLLLHLLFKALFARAPDRVSYLALLTGRSPPLLPANAGAEEMVRAIADAPRAAEPAEMETIIRGFGVPLSPADYSTIRRFHGAFIQRGLALQFNSHGRPPQSHYPTLRDLIVATDRAGRSWHYLAAETDYQFVRQLQARDRIVPVVGDVSGPHALRAIGRAIAAHGERVSAFYISNVESYLYRDGAYRPVPRQSERVAARRAEHDDSIRVSGRISRPPAAERPRLLQHVARAAARDDAVGPRRRQVSGLLGSRLRQLALTPSAT